MNQELTQELLKRLDALADKLGTTVDELWPMLVQHTYIESVLTMVSAIFGLILAAVPAYFCLRLYRKADRICTEEGAAYYRDAEVVLYIRSVFMFVVTIVVAGAALSTLCSGDTYANILVPEVAALENLLR